MRIFGSPKPDVEKLVKERDMAGLIDALGQKDTRVRGDAKKALLGFGENAIELLVEAVKYNDSDIRFEAAEILGELRGLGVVVIRGGLVKFVNAAAARLSDYARREIVEKQFVDFVSPEYEDLVLARYKGRLMSKKTPAVYEVKILSKKGEKIPVEINASLIEYEGRQADLAILRDLRPRK